MLIQSIESLSAQMQQKDVEGAQELAQIHYEAARLNTNLLQMLALYRARKDALPVDIDPALFSTWTDDDLPPRTLDPFPI